jgi:hypothetical protein
MAAVTAVTVVTAGPTYVRSCVAVLGDLCVTGGQTGWRTGLQSRVDELAAKFQGGEFGQSCACGVSILNVEVGGQKLIDDGVSTVTALNVCFTAWQLNKNTTPSGDAWDPQLLSIFTDGLYVKVVSYADDADRDARELWNVVKHDEEGNTVRWSSVFQKISIPCKIFSRDGNWDKVRVLLVAAYGKSKTTTVGRWIRAARGVDPTALAVLADMEGLKGAFIWDNMCATHRP